MKYILFSLISLFANIILGQSSPILTYDEGLESCRRVREAAKEKDPGKMVLTQPDCIVGARIPDFQAMTLAGETMDVNALLGKVTVMNFWMISCPPCIAEIPGFNLLKESYGTEQYNFVSITPESKEDVSDFLVKHPWSFSHLVVGPEVVFNTFQIRWGFPTTFVLDEQATIIAAFSGGFSDERAVAEIERKLIEIFQAHKK